MIHYTTLHINISHSNVEVIFIELILILLKGIFLKICHAHFCNTIDIIGLGFIPIIEVEGLEFSGCYVIHAVSAWFHIEFSWHGGTVQSVFTKYHLLSVHSITIIFEADIFLIIYG